MTPATRGFVILSVAAIGAAAARGQALSFFSRPSSPNFSESVRGMAADSTGMYLAGTLREFVFTTRNSHAIVRKYGPNGTETWSRGFDAPSAATAIASSGSGVYVGGNTEFGETLTGSRDSFVRRYDASGNELWTRQFGGPDHDYIRAIVADASGIYVLGWSEPDPNVILRRQWSFRKLDPNGAELWSRTLDDAVDLVADGMGSYYVTGSERSNGTGFLRRYDSAGNQVWSRTLENQERGAIAANGSGVYLASLPYTPAGNSFVRRLKASTRMEMSDGRASFRPQ
jgi:hypothetical protein